MPEILENIEVAAVNYDGAILVTAGIAAVTAGLVLWLAGLKIEKAVAALFGAAAGATAGYLFWRQNPLAGAFFGATAAAMISLIFNKAIIVLVGSVVITGLGLVFLVAHTTQRLDMSGYPGATGTDRLTQQQTLEMISQQFGFLAEKGQEIAGRLPTLAWPGFALAAIFLLALGFIFVRLIMAVSCSSIGTALIFAGMIVLLLHKGSAPLTHIYQRALYFSAVFAAMVVFGTAVQLALCRGRNQIIQSAAGENPAPKTVQGEV
jgi:hypothetical protein